MNMDMDMDMDSIVIPACPGTTHMYTFEICIWSILILVFADRCYFQNSTFDLSK
jgi:hypothetical protein